MRKLLGALFALIVSAQTAFAAITWTPGATVAWQNITFGGNTGTFTGLNGGTNYPSGSFACVSIASRRNDIQPYASVVFGSGGTTASATSIVTDSGNTTAFTITIWCASIASSTVDQIVITGNNVQFFGQIGVAAGYFTGSATTATAVGLGGFSNSATGTQTIQVGGSGANTTITNPSGGFGIAAVYGRAGVAATSCAVPTWSTTGSSNITSATGDVNSCSITNPDWITLAHTITAGSWGPSETSVPANSSNSAMVAATFGVAAAAGATPSMTLIGVGP